MIVKVVAGLVYQSDKVLIARRAYGNPEVIGKWEFPGGKVEANETEEHAIEREWMEEFEVQIKANHFVCNHVTTYPERTIDLRLYKCTYVSGTFHLHDHTEYKWMNIEDINLEEMCPADRPLVEYIRGK